MPKCTVRFRDEEISYWRSNLPQHRVAIKLEEPFKNFTISRADMSKPGGVEARVLEKLEEYRLQRLARHAHVRRRLPRRGCCAEGGAADGARRAMRVPQVHGAPLERVRDAGGVWQGQVRPGALLGLVCPERIGSVCTSPSLPLSLTGIARGERHRQPQAARVARGVGGVAQGEDADRGARRPAGAGARGALLARRAQGQAVPGDGRASQLHQHHRGGLARCEGACMSMSMSMSMRMSMSNLQCDAHAPTN